jgi:hypothetical protein
MMGAEGQGYEWKSNQMPLNQGQKILFNPQSPEHRARLNSFLSNTKIKRKFAKYSPKNSRG